MSIIIIIIQLSTPHVTSLCKIVLKVVIEYSFNFSPLNDVILVLIFIICYCASISSQMDVKLLSGYYDFYGCIHLC